MEEQKILAFQVKSLNNQIRRLMDRAALVENEANLSGGQYAILGYINEQTRKGVDVFQREIEAEFNIRRSSASAMLQGLEKAGFVYRVSVPNDARLKKIMLTPQAEELDKVARQHMDALQVRLTRGISKEELQQFYQTLQKIATNAE